jgi:aminoglycoside 3-N-acetyltransferase
VADTEQQDQPVGEFQAGASYLDIPFDPTWPTAAEIVTEGETRRVSYDRFPGCSRVFAVIEPYLRARGAIADGLVGRAAAQLMAGAAVIEETVALLARDEAALLCRDPDCYRCTRAQSRL